MQNSKWHRLVMASLLCAALGTGTANRSMFAGEPEGVSEVIPLPPIPLESIPAGPVTVCPERRGQVFQGATLSAPAISALPVSRFQVRPQDKPLPINLATALRLSYARPLIIAAAQASEEVAAAQLSAAKVLWLPNLNVGASYYQHDGGAQGNSGAFFDNVRNQTLVGGGASAFVSTTDAIFTPLAARRVVQARNSIVEAARNDALLNVAESYFNVQQARGRLAGAEDTVIKARSLVTTVHALSAGLVAPIEINRAQTVLASLEQSHAAAQGSWGAASAELTRVLRLDPTAMVLPMEPPHLQVTLIGGDRTVDELIPIGLLTRPELASQKALVQAALVRLKQERIRPLLPSVVLFGAPNPAAQGGYLMGGAFFSSSGGQGAPASARNDINVELLWTLNNMGFGNAALVRTRRAEQEQTLIELFRVQDNVAAEIARIHAELEAAAARIPEAEIGVREAQISFAGNLKGLSQTTRFGDMLTLVNRPQEVVAALQQLASAYENYFGAINDFNRAQFRLYHALGYPAGIIAYRQPLGAIQPIDTSRPEPLPPVNN